MHVIINLDHHPCGIQWIEAARLDIVLVVANQHRNNANFPIGIFVLGCLNQSKYTFDHSSLDHHGRIQINGDVDHVCGRYWSDGQ